VCVCVCVCLHHRSHDVVDFQDATERLGGQRNGTGGDQQRLWGEREEECERVYVCERVCVRVCVCE
jgi:hypothetical protein